MNVHVHCHLGAAGSGAIQAKEDIPIVFTSLKAASERKVIIIPMLSKKYRLELQRGRLSLDISTNSK